eukprot:9093084-Lingulodinium_polyedra.AAC.1
MFRLQPSESCEHTRRTLARLRLLSFPRTVSQGDPPVCAKGWGRASPRSPRNWGQVCQRPSLTASPRWHGAAIVCDSNAP